MCGRILLFFALLQLAAPSAGSGVLTFLGDNNSTFSALRDVVGYTELDGDIYFTATGLYGSELYRTDGTFDSVELVKDINPGYAGSGPSNFIVFGGKLYFTAYDGVHGLDLWRSDGTEAGTYLVKDLQLYDGIRTSTKPVANSSCLVFLAYDSNTPYGYKLYRSDGTAAGTYPVNPNFRVESNVGISLAVVGEQIFVSGDLGDRNTELWVTTGEAWSPVMVKDIRLGSSGSYPHNFVVSNGTLYFTASDGINGVELWRSNGSWTTTYMVKNIKSSVAAGSLPANLVDVNGTLYFSAYGDTGEELWKSDGTDVGTVMIKSFPGTGSSYGVHGLTAVGGGVLFSTRKISGLGDLWFSDGTSQGTTIIAANSEPTLPGAVVGETAYFSAQSDAQGRELWKSDGTAAGTAVALDLAPGLESGAPDNIASIGANLYFSVVGGEKQFSLQRYATDPGELTALHEIDDGSPADFVIGDSLAVGGTAYYSAWDGAHGTELWATDGMPGGTRLVKDIYPGVGSSNPLYFAQLNGWLYFQAHGPDGKIYLWKSAGSAESTVQLAKIDGRLLASEKDSDHLYLMGYGPDLRYRFWRTDGTSSGTVELDTSNAPIFSRLFGIGTKAIFTGNTEAGYELWVIDDASTTAELLKDIGPGRGIGAFPLITPVIDQEKGWLYFPGDDGVHGSELWRTDGTSDGTTMVRDLVPGPGGNSVLYNGALINGKYYFSNSNSTSNSGAQWVTDGTETGTVKLCDTGPLRGILFEKNYISLGDKIVFQSNGTSSGQELWVTDGTPEGTELLADINPGPEGSTPQYFVRAGANVFFTAVDGTHGSELWVTDGTAAGTRMAGDIRAGSESSQPRSMTALGDYLVFTADDGVHGREPWIFNPHTGAASMINDMEPGPLSSSYYEKLLSIGSRVVLQAFSSVVGMDLWAVTIEEQSRVEEWLQFGGLNGRAEFNPGNPPVQKP